MSFWQHPGLKAVDILMLLTLLFSAWISAANVTIDSNVTKNTFFNVGTDCVIDNASGNKYCFTKRAINERLSCAGFGVAPKFNYSDSDLGVFVEFNSSLCNPVIINDTIYPSPEFIVQEVPIKLDVNKQLAYKECFVNPAANASICAPDGRLDLVVLLKRGEVLNDSNRSLLVLVDNESFRDFAATPSPTPGPVDEGIPGVNQNQNTPPITPPPVQAPPQDNLALAVGVIALIVGGAYYFHQQKLQKQAGLEG